MKHLLTFVVLVLSVAALSITAHASDDVDPSWHGLTSFRVTGNALVDACSEPQGDRRNVTFVASFSSCVE